MSVSGHCEDIQVVTQHSVICVVPHWRNTTSPMQRARQPPPFADHLMFKSKRLHLPLSVSICKLRITESLMHEV